MARQIRNVSHERAWRLGGGAALALGSGFLISACLAQIALVQDKPFDPGSDAGPVDDASVSDASLAPDGGGGNDAPAPRDSSLDGARDAGATNCGADGAAALCNDACVSLASTTSCGACGNSCPAGDGAAPTCISSDAGFACGIACAPGTHACGLSCLLDTDAPGTAADPCVVSEAFGVFVAGSGQDTGDGSRAHPLRTIAAALAKATAVAPPLRVYACGTAGDYPEQVTIASSIDLYGGFSCSGGVWAYVTDGGVQALVDPDGGIPLSIAMPGGPVMVTEMMFKSSDGAPGSGASSIGAAINAGAAIVTLDHTKIFAGAGGSGVPGSQPNANFDAGQAATGHNASLVDYAGGSSVTCTCRDLALAQSSTGAAAGNGDTSTPSPGGYGTPVPPAGTLGPTGDGGVYGFACGAGTPGAAGKDGDGGIRAALVGSLSAVTGWVQSGGAGTSGVPGAVGQGGGGGSGGRESSVLDGGYGGGGGGGCGGCGGEWGTGGGPGGSSVALVVIQSKVIVQTCQITGGAGGAGGAGGDGQTGQLGGSGGSPSTPGCPGGAGGNGGSGGGGAGGAGGSSYGIAYTGTAPNVSGAPGASASSTGAAGGRAGAGGGAQAGAIGVTNPQQSF